MSCLWITRPGQDCHSFGPDGSPSPSMIAPYRYIFTQNHCVVKHWELPAVETPTAPSRTAARYRRKQCQCVLVEFIPDQFQLAGHILVHEFGVVKDLRFGILIGAELIRPQENKLRADGMAELCVRQSPLSAMIPQHGTPTNCKGQTARNQCPLDRPARQRM